MLVHIRAEIMGEAGKWADTRSGLSHLKVLSLVLNQVVRKHPCLGRSALSTESLGPLHTEHGKATVGLGAGPRREAVGEGEGGRTVTVRAPRGTLCHRSLWTGSSRKKKERRSLLSAAQSKRAFCFL